MKSFGNGKDKKNKKNMCLRQTEIKKHVPAARFNEFNGFGACGSIRQDSIRKI